LCNQQKNKNKNLNILIIYMKYTLTVIDCHVISWRMISSR
jgi:hypothetical protein